MSDNETQQIAQPIYYDDGKVIHACDSAIMNRGVRLVWTKCGSGSPPASPWPKRSRAC